MEFKCRCSAIGTIMTGHIGLTPTQTKDLAELLLKEKPTAKQKEKIAYLEEKQANKELPQTVKSYLDGWMKSKAFGVEIHVKSKYIDKGNAMEGAALAHMGLRKNLIRTEDDYFTGEPDAITIDTIHDIKNSWDHSTFPFFETECPNKDYWWQLQGYMRLFGLSKSELDYFLYSTEEYSYDHIHMDDRIKKFPIAEDRAAIERAIERVKLCQDYVAKRYKSVRPAPPIEDDDDF